VSCLLSSELVSGWWCVSVLLVFSFSHFSPFPSGERQDISHDVLLLAVSRESISS